VRLGLRGNQNTRCDSGVFPAGEGKAEMVEPVIERHAGDRDGELAHVGEVGQP